MAEDTKKHRSHFSDGREHTHNMALQEEYFDALCSLDRAADISNGTCEFSMALFTLVSCVLSKSTPEIRKEMLEAIGEKSEMIVAEREIVKEVVSALNTMMHPPGMEH